MRWKAFHRYPETYWKPWFAWYPVILEDTGETVWLARVWRHANYYWYQFRYRSDVDWSSANLERHIK